MHKPRIVAVASASLLAVAAGCSTTAGNTNVACHAITTTHAAPPPDWGGTVFTIVMENHDASQILNNGDAPFINQLANQNAIALGYHDPFIHPSEPNYFWMVAGENFGILNDNDPGPQNTIDSKAHIADQLEAAGLTWRSYQESMGAPCGLVSHDNYAVKHNPFVYFNDVNGWDGSKFNPTQRCMDNVVDYSQLDADLASGKLPKYVFITPNLQDDMHDGSIQQGDAWLAREVPKILASDAFNKGGVLFLLWDEGGVGIATGDYPPFIAISPNAKPGFVSHTDYDTSSYLKTVQSILGVDALPCASDASAVPVMSDLFTVPVSAAQPASAPPQGTAPAPTTK
jgi:phospholipase C